MKFIKPLLKLTFVGGLLYLLVLKGFISVEATTRAFSRPDKIIPGVCILLMTTLLSIVRWQWLLQAQGIRMRMGRTFELAMVGNFFNIALPGAVSGDFVKAFYVAKEVQGHKSRAFGSILFDRVAGLSALLILAAGALALGHSQIAGSGFFPAVRILVLLPGVAFLCFYVYLFLVKEHHDPLLKLAKKTEARYPKFAAFTRLYEGIRHYHNHRWTVVRGLFLSILIHFGVCVTCTLFLQALGEESFSPIAIFIGVPIGLLFTAIPLAPAGVGTGHAAFSWLLHFAGTARGADVFSLFALTQLFIGALGGLVFLRFRKSEPMVEMDAKVASETAV